MYRCCWSSSLCQQSNNFNLKFPVSPQMEAGLTPGPRRRRKLLTTCWSSPALCRPCPAQGPPRWAAAQTVPRPPLPPRTRSTSTPPSSTSVLNLARPPPPPAPPAASSGTTCLSPRPSQTRETPQCRPRAPPSTWSSRAAGRGPDCPLRTGGARRVGRKVSGPSTAVLTVANITPPAATSPGTGRPTGAWTRTMLKSATSVTRCTSACRPSACTSSPTTSTTSANSVGKLSPGRGSCRATWGPTLGTSLTPAMFVVNLLLTDQIWGHTCRPIPRLKISNVHVVRSPLL